MRALHKAAFLAVAGATALTSVATSSPVRAGEANAVAATTDLDATPAPAADGLVAQADQVAQSTTIVEEAVVYEQGTGFYGTLGIGGTWPDDIDGRVRRPNRPDPRLKLDTTGGFALDAGVGYDFGPVRTELTYIYNRNGVDDVRFRQNWRARDTDGGNQNGIMASAYWDINTGSRFTPYIGGGIGWINQNWGNNTVERVVNGRVTDRVRTGSGNVDLFGWQAKVGVAYGVNWNTDIYAEAVYQGAESFNVGRTSYDALNQWGFKIGARYRFGGQAVAVVQEEVPVTPAPAPAPAPAPVYREPAPAPAPAPAPIRGLW
jgi:opacity protein-like surface antigen